VTWAWNLAHAGALVQLVWLGVGFWQLAANRVEAVWASYAIAHFCLGTIVLSPTWAQRRSNGLIFKGKEKNWLCAASLFTCTIGCLTMGVFSFCKPIKFHFSMQTAIALYWDVVCWGKRSRDLVHWRREVANRTTASRCGRMLGVDDGNVESGCPGRDERSQEQLTRYA
jgi:hypothetical protein